MTEGVGPFPEQKGASDTLCNALIPAWAMVKSRKLIGGQREQLLRRPGGGPIDRRTDPGHFGHERRPNPARDFPGRYDLWQDSSDFPVAPATLRVRV